MTQRYELNCQSLLLTSYVRDEQNALRWVRHGIETLPREVQPTHFGETERIRKKRTNQLSDRTRFENFLRRHRGTFFLYGDRLLVDVRRPGRIQPEVTYWASQMDSRFLDYSAIILESFEQYGGGYGYACSWDELEARNQTRVRISGGVATGLRGQNFRRYITGLYWLNYFSDEYLAEMALDLEAVAAKLEGALHSTPNGKILRLYDQPTDWRTREELVGDVIHETPNVFSIRDIEIPPALDDLQYHHWSDKVFQQWP